jgi:P-type E1-E2 ATPase
MKFWRRTTFIQRMWRWLATWWRLLGVAVAALAGGILTIFSMPTIGAWVLAVLSLLLLIPMLVDMWQSWQNGGYENTILAVIAIVLAVILQDGWTALVLVAAVTVADWLAGVALHRAAKDLEKVGGALPSEATVLRGRRHVTVPASQLQPGDKIVVQQGEAVPADGTLFSTDETTVDERAFPGGRGNAKILAGGIVFAGAISQNTEEIIIRCSARQHDSRFHRLQVAARSAQHSQPALEVVGGKFAIAFTVVALALGLAAWLSSGHFSRLLLVLTVATPFAILTSPSIAFTASLSRAARLGIITKHANILEKLAKAPSLVIAKTGTLTPLRPTLAHVKTYGTHSFKEVLSLAASLAQTADFDTPFAESILAAAAENRLKISKVKHANNATGQGADAVIAGRNIVLGTPEFVLAENSGFPSRSKLASLTTPAYALAVNGKAAGLLTFSDSPRPLAAATLTRLRELGLTNILLSTDEQPSSAKSATHDFDIPAENIWPAQSSTQKLQALEAIQERPAAYISSRASDAALLHSADVGIALDSNLANVRQADIVILPDDIALLASSVDIASRSFRIAKRLMRVGGTISLILVLIFGFLPFVPFIQPFPPLIGAAAQGVLDVLIIFSLLAAFRTSPKRAEA